MSLKKTIPAFTSKYGQRLNKYPIKMAYYVGNHPIFTD